jgi:hypothetical protein
MLSHLYHVVCRWRGSDGDQHERAFVIKLTAQPRLGNGSHASVRHTMLLLLLLVITAKARTAISVYQLLMQNCHDSGHGSTEGIQLDTCQSYQSMHTVY